MSFYLSNDKFDRNSDSRFLIEFYDNNIMQIKTANSLHFKTTFRSSRIPNDLATLADFMVSFWLVQFLVTM